MNVYNVFVGLRMHHKKLLYQSLHRGCKEMDFILGEFACDNLDNLTQEELTDYEKLLEVEDVYIYDWISGKSDIPGQFRTPLMEKIKNFTHRKRNV